MLVDILWCVMTGDDGVRRDVWGERASAAAWTYVCKPVGGG